MMDVDEPSASGRAARTQEGSNNLGMLTCATTECQSKHARLHHGLFGIARLWAVLTKKILHVPAGPQHVQ